MKVRVTRWDSAQDCHEARDMETGNMMRIDLVVSGELGEIDPASLVGKVVEYEYDHPFISIAHGVKIAEVQP